MRCAGGGRPEGPATSQQNWQASFNHPPKSYSYWPTATADVSGWRRSTVLQQSDSMRCGRVQSSPPSELQMQEESLESGTPRSKLDPNSARLGLGGRRSCKALSFRKRCSALHYKDPRDSQRPGAPLAPAPCELTPKEARAACPSPAHGNPGPWHRRNR